MKTVVMKAEEAVVLGEDADSKQAGDEDETRKLGAMIAPTFPIMCSPLPPPPPRYNTLLSAATTIASSRCSAASRVLSFRDSASSDKKTLCSLRQSATDEDDGNTAVGDVNFGGGSGRGDDDGAAAAIAWDNTDMI